MADIEELQEKLTEGDDEEEDLGSNEPQIDMSFLDEQPEKPSVADAIARRAQAAGSKAGSAARGLLSGVGSQLGEPTPPEDDISDLFEGPDMERDNDVYIKDVVSVSEEDVFGEGGEEGLEEVLEVSEEDVMGDEDYTGYGGRSTPKQPTRRTIRPTPQGGLAGLQ